MKAAAADNRQPGVFFRYEPSIAGGGCQEQIDRLTLALPPEIQALRQFLVWKYEPAPDGGKSRKVPYYVNGQRRHGTQGAPADREQLGAFAEALKALESGGCAGPGVAMLREADLVGLDLDNCYADGRIDPKVAPLVAGTYCEVSPSGKGIRAFYRGSYRDGKNHAAGVEVFCEKGFLTLTGNRLNGDGVSPLPDTVKTHLDRIFYPKQSNGDRPEPSAETILAGVPEGGRDTALFRYACRLRGKGLTREEAQTLVLTAAANCSPPFPESQALEKLRSAWRYDPPSEPTGETIDVLKCLSDNEVGDAALFNHLNAGKYIFDHAAGVWYVWGAHCWLEDVRNEALAGGVDAVVDAYADEATRQGWAATTAAKAGRTDEAEKHEANRKALLARIKLLQTVNRRRNVLTQAAAGTGLCGDEWDQRPMVLAVTNGVIDLTTGELHPGRPEDFLKTCAPTEYLGIKTACPIWDNFLLEVFNGVQAVIAYLQRLFGYALAGWVIEHILLIFYGTGRNGKGTFLEAIKRVLGDYAFKAESELLLEQRYAKASGAPNSGLLALRGKRTVWVSETDEGRKLSTARVKELVGGDTLNARAVYGKRHVEFAPTHLLLLLTNNKPTAPAGDFALWQRIHLIPFEMAFIHKPEKTNERKVDPHIGDKLKAEAAGILAWMVRGCLEYQRQGLNPPETVMAATEAYRRDEDTIVHFIEECCELAPVAEVKAGALHSAYKEWCNENSYRPFGPKRFGEDIRARGFDSYSGTMRGARGTFFIGLRLISPGG